MTQEKIRDIKPICNHPDHNPPSHMVFEPGYYKHTCPACTEVTEFTVNPPTL